MTLMSHYYPLYEVEQYEVKPQGGASIIRLNPHHAVYRGHFPADPITPGACLVQIGINLIKEYLPTPIHNLEIRQAKFLKVVRPNDEPLRYDWIIQASKPGAVVIRFKVWLAEELASHFSLELKNNI